MFPWYFASFQLQAWRRSNGNDMPLSPGTFSDATTPYKQSDYEILVPTGVGLEFKLSMKAGDFMVYSWTVRRDGPGSAGRGIPRAYRTR